MVRAGSADPAALLEGIRRADCYMAVGAIALDLSAHEGVVRARTDDATGPPLRFTCALD